MPYTFALQSPESPVKEEWRWTTDLIVSYDGSEDRVPLNRYPKRSFSGQYSFDRVEDVRRHLAFMHSTLRGELGLPLYQYQVKLKAKVTGGDTVQVNALRSDFRVGEKALLVEGDDYQIMTVATVLADSVTFEETIGGSYSSRALLMPMTGVYAPTGMSAGRFNADGSATADFRYMEARPWTPFVSPLNEESLTMFDGLAVLDQNATGNQFDQTIDTGILITDYTGLPDFFTPWTQSQWAFPVRYLCNRVLDNASWLWWFAFADHLQGSSTPFLLPTFRADLEVVTPVAGSGTQVVVKGHEYSEHYFPLDTFKRVVVESDAGTHYAKVTAVTDVAGNDRLTLSPAIPAGSGWTTNQKISFLLRVRIADDKITCDHYGLQTEISMAIRTVE